MPELQRLGGALDREPAIDAWLDERPVELGAIARRWFMQMRRCGTGVRELLHDGCPVVCVEDAPFGYVNAFTAHVNVGFFQGASLSDPAGLLEGTGRRMRHVKLKPGRAFDEPSLEALITAAYLDIHAKLQARSSDVILRRGLVSDAAALAAFAARTFEETYAADNRPEDMRAHLATHYGIAQQSAELADPSVATVLAVAGTGLLAYAQVRSRQPPPCVTNDHPIELHRFYVDRVAHGSGLARRLMRAAMSAALQLGGRHLWLSVWERNPRAMAFYRKSAFVDVGATHFMVGPDRQTDRVLVAALSPDVHDAV